MAHEQLVRDYEVIQAVQFVFYAAVAGYQYYMLRRDRRQWAEEDKVREAQLLREESRYSDTSKS